MSLHLEFEPHSWYKQFAIKKTRKATSALKLSQMNYEWEAYTANGNSGYIDELTAPTLKELKQKITEYHQRNAERDAYNRKMIGEE